MDLVSLIILLVVVGVALYLIGLIPMDGRILTAIRAIVLLVVVLWLIAALFGASVPLHVGHGRCL